MLSSIGLVIPSISGICFSMSAHLWLTSIYFPSSSFVFNDCSTALDVIPFDVLLTMITFLAITTRFLAVRNLKRISPFTYAVPAMLGSITKDFYIREEGGNTPVVIYFRH